MCCACVHVPNQYVPLNSKETNLISVYCYGVLFIDNNTSMLVISNETINTIREFRLKYSITIRKLKLLMESFVGDPKNAYSVQDMIINLCSADNGLTVFSTDDNLKGQSVRVVLFISKAIQFH